MYTNGRSSISLHKNKWKVVLINWAHHLNFEHLVTEMCKSCILHTTYQHTVHTTYQHTEQCPLLRLVSWLWIWSISCLGLQESQNFPQDMPCLVYWALHMHLQRIQRQFQLLQCHLQVFPKKEELCSKITKIKKKKKNIQYPKFT